MLRPSSLASGLSFFAVLGSLVAISDRFFPYNDWLLGRDYMLAVPAWMDGYFWFSNSGWSTPWFTPAFCARQPFFADPQSGYYSLPHVLAALAGPMTAAYLTFLASAMLFWDGYFLMTMAFSSRAAAAKLVGGLLMLNGFLSHHLVVGHVGYRGLALVPWLALSLLIPARYSLDAWTSGIAAGVILAYWVHSGFGTQMLAATLTIVLNTSTSTTPRPTAPWPRFGVSPAPTPASRPL